MKEQSIEEYSHSSFYLLVLLLILPSLQSYLVSLPPSYSSIFLMPFNFITSFLFCLFPLIFSFFKFLLVLLPYFSASLLSYHYLFSHPLQSYLLAQLQLCHAVLRSVFIDAVQDALGEVLLVVAGI